MHSKLIDPTNGEIFSTSESHWHGRDYGLLDLQVESDFDPTKVDLNYSGLWRYRKAIPIDREENIVSFSEGFTPLVSLRLPSGFEVKVKLDFLFPSGSYKDRGASILTSKMKELGISDMVQDSSGNAGAAMAAYTAKAGIPCKIYLPENTPGSKIAQIAAYGAQIIQVPGDRKATASLAFEAAKTSYYASHCFNPYFFQGTKTFAYEVCEQLNWKAPDTLILPAGNGTLLLGCYMGFTELFEKNIISKIPRLIAVQSEHCQPLFLKQQNSLFDMEQYTPLFTLAEGIAIPNPVRWKQMLEAVQNTQGKILLVNDEDITKTWKWLASTGYFVELTSAASIAGMIQYAQSLNQQETTVGVFTGSGLKSLEKIDKILSVSKQNK